MAKTNYSGLSLHFLLPAMEEEHILSALYRAMHAGQHVRVKDLATTLVDRLTIQPPWTLPSHLNKLAVELNPLFTSGEEILRQHTCLPAHLPFVAPERLAGVMAHALEGVRGKGVASALGLTGNFVQSKPRLRVCRACVAAQELEHGFTFWRREHALASVTFCAEHGQPLLVGCGSCRFTQLGSREPLLPGRRCWCGGRLVPDGDRLTPADWGTATRIARAARVLLNGALNGRGADDVGGYFQWRAHQAGFGDGTRVHSPMIARAIEEQYSPELLTTLNAQFQDGRNWTDSIFGTGRASPCLGRNLLLFDFFGQHVPTPEDFRLSEEHRQRMAFHREITRQRASVGTPEEILADRRVIETFIQQNPGTTRSRALTVLGRTAVRARERDGEWYERILPTRPRGGRPNGEASRAQYVIDFDEKASAHVIKRRDELLNHPGGYPKAISKAALLKGLPRGNEVGGAFLEQLPKTAAAIAAAVETKEQFKPRFALAILRQGGKKSLAERLHEAYRRTGLSPSVLEELNYSLMKEAEWQTQRQDSGS